MLTSIVQSVRPYSNPCIVTYDDSVLKGVEPSRRHVNHREHQDYPNQDRRLEQPCLDHSQPACFKINETSQDYNNILSTDLDLTLLWSRCRPSWGGTHQRGGPEYASTCWHGHCIHPSMHWLRIPQPVVLQCATHTAPHTACNFSQQNTLLKKTRYLLPLRPGRPWESEPLGSCLFLRRVDMSGKDNENGWQMSCSLQWSTSSGEQKWCARFGMAVSASPVR